MKYIISYIFWVYSSTPCPQQDEYDKIFGKGYSCCVGHGKITPEHRNFYFTNYMYANEHYKSMVEYKARSYFNILDPSTGKPTKEYIFPTVDSLKIDSIPTIKK